MSLKTRFLLGALLIVLAALLAMWFSPTAVSNGVRWWAWWKASQEGLVVTIDKIDAPFLRPVVIRGFRVASLPRNAFRGCVANCATATHPGMRSRSAAG